MKYLFDTCVVSEFNKKNPEKQLIDWIGFIDEDDCYISVLTIGEIYKGIAKLDNGLKKDNIRKWLERDLIERFENKILPFTEKTAKIWGKIQGESEKQGICIPTIDGLIAATAQEYDLILVTRNESDFNKTEISIINPWNK